MEKNKSKKILTWLAVASWMAIIFAFSAMKGSSEHYFTWTYFLERKSFHVIEYFILSVLFYQVFSQYFLLKKAVWFAVAGALLYAASDEWHQTFVFGRTGLARDVVIDLIGIGIAAIFILKFTKWKKKKK